MKASLFLGFLSCFASGQQDELNAAKDLWGGILESVNGSPVNYNYAYVDSASSGSPSYQTRVRNGSSLSSYSVGAQPDPGSLYTVENLFDAIQNAIDGKSDVSASYDGAYGFPASWTLEDLNGTITEGSIQLFTLFTLLESQWNKHIATWNALDAQDYNYTVEVNGFMPQEYLTAKRIQVRKGVIADIVEISSGNSIALDLYPYPTVDDAFGDISVALNNFYGFVQVTYNKTLGYPTDYVLTQDIFISDGPPSIKIYDVEVGDGKSGGGEGGDGGGISDDAQMLLDTSKALWESKGISKYHFGLQKDCFCVFREPISVYVDGGQVTKMTTRFGDEVTQSDTFYSLSIEDLFDEIQNAITEQYDSLVVSYDADYGYPTSVSIDKSEMLADDEYVYVVDYMSPVSMWQTDFDGAKALWKSQNLNTYNYTYQRSCECVEEFTRPKYVEVVNGKVSTVNGSPVEVIQRSSNDIPTIDGLFAKIQDGIDQGAFRLTNVFDDQYGYPTSIFIDYNEMIADEEYIVTATLEIPESPGPESAPTAAPEDSGASKFGSFPILSSLLGAFVWMIAVA